MDAQTDEILEEVFRETGVDLHQYRSETVENGIAERSATMDAESRPAYLAILQNRPSEAILLLNRIGINYSIFFRDPMVFEWVEQRILPEILAEKEKSGCRDIRIWSVGCATGEEAYSLAIIANRIFKSKGKDRQVYIFATDIDSDALKKAANAVYFQKALKNIKLGFLDRYFIETEKTFTVRPFIRKMVHFSWDDCTSSRMIAPAESVFGTFDLILCRNVLIYFNRELQQAVLKRLYRAMGQNGYLILGESEYLDPETETLLKTIDIRNRIFQKK